MNNSPTYWIACSGGVDSIVLLHLFSKTQRKIGVLHCNFHLRGQASAQDQKLVEETAQKLGLPIQIKEFDTYSYMEEKGLNLELAARELRYTWFEEVIQKGDVVVLGHHRDDLIETFFLQLRRGAKVKGLSAMTTFRKGYFRPLLNYSKDDLLQLARKYNWKWREDESNRSNEYLRNWYRNEILPLLIERGMNEELLVELIHDFQQILYCFQMQFTLPTEIQKKEWVELPKWWKYFVLSEYQLSEFPLDEVNKLIEAPKGKFIGNRKTSVWSEKTTLLFQRNEPKNTFDLVIKELAREEIRHLKKEAIYIDASKYKGEFLYRKWKEGDTFQPIGMKGKKKVSKFLRDRDVKSAEKKNVYILTTSQDEILGIFGFGCDNRFKIDESSKQIVEIILKKS